MRQTVESPTQTSPKHHSVQRQEEECPVNVSSEYLSLELNRLLRLVSYVIKIADTHVFLTVDSKRTRVLTPAFQVMSQS